MPRYLIEAASGAERGLTSAGLAGIIERNLMGSVTWICSFVGDRRTYALYEGPHPEAVRRAAGTAGLEVDRVSEVRLLDPFAYRGPPATDPPDPHHPQDEGAPDATVHGRPHA